MSSTVGRRGDHSCRCVSLVSKMFGYALMIGSFANWFSIVVTAEDIEPSNAVFLAIGDWDCPTSRDLNGSDGTPFDCARPQLDVAGMIKKRTNNQDLTRPAFVLNLGDSFHPRGVTSAADLYHRAVIHAKLYGNANSDDIPWYSVLGSHDSLGNVSVVVPGEHRLLKYPARYYQWQRNLSRQRSMQFIALDTTVVDAASVCGKKEPKHGVDACVQEMKLRWKEQLLWLTATLNNSQATWRIVFGHHPVFGTDLPPTPWAFHGTDPTFLRDALVPLFTGFHVSLYLSGHDHLSQLMEHKGVLYGIFGAGGGSELHGHELQGALHVPKEVQVLTTVAAFGLGTIDIGDTAYGEGVCITILSSSPHSGTHLHCATETSPSLVMSDDQRVAYLAEVYGAGSAPRDASLDGFQIVDTSALVAAGLYREAATLWCTKTAQCPEQDGTLLPTFAWDMPCHMRVFDKFDSLVMTEQVVVDSNLRKSIGFEPRNTQRAERPWTSESLATIQRIALKAHLFVEVTRMKDNWLNKAPGGGSWFYAARGSGIFVNLGRTVAFAEHSDAFASLLPNESFDINAIIARGRKLADYMIYARLFAKAASMGIDTIQFTRLCNMGAPPPCLCVRNRNR
eukprot:SAG31_NODE_2237_length_6120_cov_7.767276_3_plen_621_part_00